MLQPTRGMILQTEEKTAVASQIKTPEKNKTSCSDDDDQSSTTSENVAYPPKRFNQKSTPLSNFVMPTEKSTRN